MNVSGARLSGPPVGQEEVQFMPEDRVAHLIDLQNMVIF